MSQPHLNSCDKNAACALRDGIYSCVCDDGYQDDGAGGCALTPVCENGASERRACTGNDAGLNGQATREFLCEDGQWVYVRAGDQHTCGFHGHPMTGELLCCGNNASGQVGDGTQTNRTSPTPL